MNGVELPEPDGERELSVHYVNEHFVGNEKGHFFSDEKQCARESVTVGCVRFIEWPEGWSKPQPPRSEDSWPDGTPKAFDNYEHDRQFAEDSPPPIGREWDVLVMHGVLCTATGDPDAVAKAMEFYQNCGAEKIRVREVQVAAEPTLPEGVPVPPEGFDYFGKGPLKFEDGGAEFYAHDFMRHNFSCYGWQPGGRGTGSRCHYAIRRGSELHSLNFREDGTPLP